MLSIALASLALATSVASHQEPNGTGCLNDEAAWRVAQNYAKLASKYNDADADRFFAEDTSLIADSTNTMLNLGCPNGPTRLDEPVYTNRESFKKGQSQQPNIPFEVIDVRHDCTSVTFRWVSRDPVGDAPTRTEPVQPVRGIILVDTVPGQGDEPFLIEKVYSEFNTAVFLRGAGSMQPEWCDENGVGPLPDAYKPLGEEDREL